MKTPNMISSERTMTRAGRTFVDVGIVGVMAGSLLLTSCATGGGPPVATEGGPPIAEVLREGAETPAAPDRPEAEASPQGAAPKAGPAAEGPSAEAKVHVQAAPQPAQAAPAPVQIVDGEAIARATAKPPIGAEALKAPAREKPAPPPGLSKKIS